MGGLFSTAQGTGHEAQGSRPGMWSEEDMALRDELVATLTAALAAHRDAGSEAHAVSLACGEWSHVPAAQMFHFISTDAAMDGGLSIRFDESVTGPDHAPEFLQAHTDYVAISSAGILSLVAPGDSDAAVSTRTELASRWDIRVLMADGEVIRDVADGGGGGASTACFVPSSSGGLALDLNLHIVTIAASRRDIGLPADLSDYGPLQVVIPDVDLRLAVHVDAPLATN